MSEQDRDASSTQVVFELRRCLVFRKDPTGTDDFAGFTQVAKHQENTIATRTRIEVRNG